MESPQLHPDSFKEAFNDDAFCFEVARHFYPFHFKVEEYIGNTFFGRVLFTNFISNDLIRGLVPGIRKFDVSFIVYSNFEKSYRVSAKNKIEKELDLPPIHRGLVSGPFNILARKKITSSSSLFIKSLKYYRADTLVVEEIEVDDLSLDEIKEIAKGERYRMALLGEIGH